MPNPRGWHEGTEPITSPSCISTAPIHYPNPTSPTFPYTHGPTLVFLVHCLSALSPCLLFLTSLDVHLARLSSHFSWHLTAATSPTPVCLTLLYLTRLWLVSLSYCFSLSRFVTSRCLTLSPRRFVSFVQLASYCRNHSYFTFLATLDQRAIQPGQLDVFPDSQIYERALLPIVVAPHPTFPRFPDTRGLCRRLLRHPTPHFSWHLTATIFSSLISAGISLPQH